MNKYLIVVILLTGAFAVSNAQLSHNSLVSVSRTDNGTIYVLIQKQSDYKIDSALYAVFIPDSIPVIRGVFIHQHGCTMEGRGMATAFDIQYQAFAKKWQLAIVGPDLYAKNNCHDWKDPKSGSAAALLATLNEISVLARQPTIKDAPWLLWGHSGGGYWAQAMMVAYPERVLALFSYSPGLDADFNYPEAALKIPVMIRYAGAEGDACCWQTAVRTFRQLREKSGYAGIAYTRYQHHNYSYVRYMAIPFFEAVMQQRLPENPKAGYKAMKPMDASRAWIGDTSRLNIFPYGMYTGQKNAAAWLPDSATAVKWREYVVTGTVVDRTPPPAPYNLRLSRRHNMVVELKWKADADVESGISHFNIYKDGVLIGRFPSSGVYQGFDTNGDDAYPLLLPELQTDITLPWNDKGKIEISTVNHFGLESLKIHVP